MIGPDVHLASDAVIAYVDGELPDVAVRRAREHMRACTECRTVVDRHRLAKAMLGSTTAPGLSDDFMRRLRAIPGTASSPARDFLLAAGQVGVSFTGATRPEQAPPPQPGPAQPEPSPPEPSPPEPSQHVSTPPGPTPTSQPHLGPRLRRGLGGTAVGVAVGAIAIAGTLAQSPGTQSPGTQHTGTQHTGTQHAGIQRAGIQHAGIQRPTDRAAPADARAWPADATGRLTVALPGGSAAPDPVRTFGLQLRAAVPTGSSGNPAGSAVAAASNTFGAQPAPGR